jgi:hypothetical protein
MLVVCLLSIVIIAAVLLYSICAFSSRISHYFQHRALVFLAPFTAEPFKDLLAAGDLESVYRLLKALEQRGDLLVLETDKEIYIVRPEMRSQGILPKMTAG